MTRPWIRKSGALKGQVIGHHTCPIRLDIWNSLQTLKTDLDMESLTNTDFLLYIVTFVREHHGRGEELEAMKASVVKATKKLDIKDIDEMTEEEAKEAYKQLMLEEGEEQ